VIAEDFSDNKSIQSKIDFANNSKEVPELIRVNESIANNSSIIHLYLSKSITNLSQSNSTLLLSSFRRALRIWISLFAFFGCCFLLPCYIALRRHKLGSCRYAKLTDFAREEVEKDIEDIVWFGFIIGAIFFFFRAIVFLFEITWINIPFKIQILIWSESFTFFIVIMINVFLCELSENFYLVRRFFKNKSKDVILNLFEKVHHFALAGWAVLLIPSITAAMGKDSLNQFSDLLYYVIFLLIVITYIHLLYYRILQVGIKLAELYK